MTTLVLNDETSQTTIGALLASATGPVVRLTDEAGNLLAQVVLEPKAFAHSFVAEGEAHIDEIRRRAKSDRSRGVTTDQLLERARQLAGE